MRISDTSMLPEFEPGDVVIIDPIRQPEIGDLVVACNAEGKQTFRQYRPIDADRFDLVAHDDIRPTNRSDGHGLRIIGTMVERRRKYRQPLAAAR